MRFTFPLLASLVLTALAPAQGPCADLTVTRADSEITFDLTTDGEANALALIVIGETEGSTTIDFGPLGSLELGLAVPFAPLPIGPTDMDGDASVSFTLPAGLPVLDLFAQGLTAELTIGSSEGVLPSIPMISLEFCTSNVAGFQLN